MIVSLSPSPLRLVSPRLVLGCLVSLLHPAGHLSSGASPRTAPNGSPSPSPVLCLVLLLLLSLLLLLFAILTAPSTHFAARLPPFAAPPFLRPTDPLNCSSCILRCIAACSYYVPTNRSAADCRPPSRLPPIPSLPTRPTLQRPLGQTRFGLVWFSRDYHDHHYLCSHINIVIFGPAHTHTHAHTCAVTERDSHTHCKSCSRCKFAG